MIFRVFLLIHFNIITQNCCLNKTTLILPVAFLLSVSTVLGTLTRSITLDIVDMSTLGRQYVEVSESVLLNIPKIDCLVSKLALTFKMIQLIIIYACVLFSK